MLAEVITAFFLIAICLVIHSTGIVVVGVAIVRRREALERSISYVQSSAILIVVFAVLMLLHLVENCIWAAFYYWQGLIQSFEEALYFSLATYTTIGYGDVLLPERWRLLGSLEGISGVLLCGLSTAVLFAIVSALFQLRVQQINLKTNSTDAGAPPN